MPENLGLKSLQVKEKNWAVLTYASEAFVGGRFRIKNKQSKMNAARFLKLEMFVVVRRAWEGPKK